MYQSVCYLHCSKKSLVYSLSLGGWFKPTESKCCFFFAFLGGYRVQKLPDSCWLVSFSRHHDSCALYSNSVVNTWTVSCVEAELWGLAGKIVNLLLQ